MTDAPSPPIFVTGASGLIGRRFLAELAARNHGSVVALARDPEKLRSSPHWLPAWRITRGDLGDSSVQFNIPHGSVVIHLAAAVGKLSPRDYAAVNVEGTRRLLAASLAANASHFVFVSSIAAGYRNKRWYPYATSKAAAERLVAAGGLPSTIVRPTIVFGHGSPVEVALRRLALAPIRLGWGRVNVQPVAADDVARFLVSLATVVKGAGDVLELGGADRLTMAALLDRCRAAAAKPAGFAIPVPLAPIRLILGLLEPFARLILPMTAGQLAAFVNDSTARPNPLVTRLLPDPRGVDDMLRENGTHA
jgi:uncharacterized protein YbjT (DUF2867 family)